MGAAIRLPADPFQKSQPSSLASIDEISQPIQAWHFIISKLAASSHCQNATDGLPVCDRQRVAMQFLWTKTHKCRYMGTKIMASLGGRGWWLWQCPPPWPILSTPCRHSSCLQETAAKLGPYTHTPALSLDHSYFIAVPKSVLQQSSYWSCSNEAK